MKTKLAAVLFSLSASQAFGAEVVLHPGEAHRYLDYFGNAKIVRCEPKVESIPPNRVHVSVAPHVACLRGLPPMNAEGLVTAAQACATSNSDQDRLIGTCSEIETRVNEELALELKEKVQGKLSDAEWNRLRSTSASRLYRCEL